MAKTNNKASRGRKTKADSNDEEAPKKLQKTEENDKTESGSEGEEAGSSEEKSGTSSAPAPKEKGTKKQLKLSPALSSLLGHKRLSRPEVVKKMWALIKERNLYDPENKQFAICDDELYKVIGVKRFRTFGMMKHLKTHFLE